MSVSRRTLFGFVAAAPLAAKAAVGAPWPAAVYEWTVYPDGIVTESMGGDYGRQPVTTDRYFRVVGFDDDDAIKVETWGCWP